LWGGSFLLSFTILGTLAIMRKSEPIAVIYASLISLSALLALGSAMTH
jgi:hypothetical protein